MKKPTFSRIAITVLLLFFSLQIFAQNYVPFTPRFNEDLKGDIILIGNNILGPDNNAFNNNNVYNHTVDMRYIDIDSDASTFSSSSADLDIPNPNCYQIKYAGLYWGAVSNGSEPITNVKFKGPSGGYNDVVGTVVYDANGVATGDSFPYSCYADVTSIVTGLASNLGTYTVANVSSAEGETSSFDPYNGTGYSAGWSLFVVYEDPTLPGKSITSFDGFSAISSSVNVDIPISGFRTVPAPAPVRANFAFAALEGDKPIQNDRLVLNGIPMSAADRPANNFFNSSVTQLNALPVNNRVPNSTNTLGFDTGVMVVPNPGNTVIANDATSATVRLESNQDVYFQYFFAFAVEIIEPNIVLTKIVEDDLGNDIGGQTVGLGSPLNYVIGFQNTGNDNATNFQVRDILPINIIFNYPTDLVLPAGVTVVSYNPTTREIIFDIEDYLVEENDPVLEIRIEVQVVDTCNQLADACSNIINNQAFASYSGFFNPNFNITDDPSLSSNTGCLFTPQATNFLADLDDCLFSQNEVLCGASLDLTAANGYDSYSWSTSPTGTPVIGSSQTVTVTETGTYYAFNTAIAPCQSIVQEFVVELFGGNIPNPVIPFADEVVTCPNDGKLLPNIFLCGANDSRNIQTSISGASSIIWEQLDESSCTAVSNPDCANEDDACAWNQVGTGPDFLANTSGQFRLTINFSGGCFVQFYFNVYQNILNPTVIATDIICTTPGSITVGSVPSGYEYSLDGTTYQTSNTFSINTPGTYTVYIRQIGVATNPCIFTVPDVQIRERDFTVSTLVTQPLCYGDKGNIQLAANDVDPQYFFSLYDGATLVNSVGPIMENNYTFSNLYPGTYTATIETEDGCLYTEDITIIEPPLLTVIAALTLPLTCTDGEITVYPEGGTPPYFYFVNSTTVFQTVPEIVVTASGVYNIMVVDSNNCSANTLITVDAIPAPDFNVSTTDILCADAGNTGSITINVTAANGNSLMYSIDGGVTFFNSPVFTSLASGDYDVVVQYTSGLSVCLTDPQTVTILSSSAISGTATLTTPYTCSTNGEITVSGVSGGNPPYSYSIDGITYQTGNTFSGLTSGTYTITIKDSNDCTFIANQITIDPLNPPIDLTFSNSPLTCPLNTSSVTITGVTGGTGTLEYQIIAPATAVTAYQTSNIFTGLAPDTYTFQVRDANDCVYSESHTIAPLPLLTVSANLIKDLDCTASPDAIITGVISGGSAPFTYAVSINGGAYTTLGATGSPFNYSTPTDGTYQFQITDANGCIAETGVQTVSVISLPEILSVIQTQPILCHGDSNAAIDITINNAAGTPPFVINVFNNTLGIDFGTQTSSLPAGDYSITLTDSKSCTDIEAITIAEPNAIIFDLTKVDITCNNPGGSSLGSITIENVSGGTTPFTYFITNNFGDIIPGNPYSATANEDHTFSIINFGTYTINVIDANGCSLSQQIVIASPPSDLLIDVTTTVPDCASGGTAEVTAISVVGSGSYEFGILEFNTIPYTTTYVGPDIPGGDTRTFTNLTPGVIYTFVVHDLVTDCYYVKSADAPIAPASTLTSSVIPNNVVCQGENNGSVTFTIDNFDSSTNSVDYAIYTAFTNVLIDGPTNLPVTFGVPETVTTPNPGTLAPGQYYIVFTENGSGSFNGCLSASVVFEINESAIDLSLSATIDGNANCNPNSGVISTIASNGTAPYLYQLTTSATPPLDTDPLWATLSTFNVDSGSYYVHVIDAFGCIKSTPVLDVIQDPEPVIAATLSNQCTVTEGDFEIDVSLTTVGMAPYVISIDGGAFQNQSMPFSISNLLSGTHTIEIQDVNGCGNLISVDIAPPLVLIPSVSVLPTCNDDDGEVTILGSGGTGIYTYAINPNPTSINLIGNVFSGVPSGLYTVTITDATTLCTEDITLVVPSATAPTVTTLPRGVTCFGDNSGEFEININGYSGPYNYEVFDSFGASVTGVITANTSTNPELVTGMSAGIFTIVMTETSNPFCSATSTVIISSPSDVLTVIASETSNVTCDDINGTITAIANGGWGTYEYGLTGSATVNYSSNGTFSNLSAGLYTINVRDAEGCIASDTITLVAPTPIAATFTPSTTLLSCFGDQNASITVTNVTGGQGSNYTYTLNTILPTPSSSGPQLSNVFNDLGPGTYSITINDGYNCDASSLDIVISQPTQIQSNLVKETSQTCLIDATLTLSATGGTGPYTYSDSGTFATVLGAFATSATFSVPEGTYVYYVRDVNGCIANVSNEITIEPLETLILNIDATNATINCAGDNTGVIIATAQGGLGNYIYTLQDTLGNVIPATQNTPGVFTELISGNYIVAVESGDCDTMSLPISITEPTSPLDVTFIISDVTCSGTNDGSIEIIANGGTGIIKYAISPQLNQFFETNIFENLAPGDYDVIVQDELGCFVTFNFTITEPIPVIITIVPSSILSEVCDGDADGEFSIDISGGTSPYSVSLDDYNGVYTTGALGQTVFDFTGLGGGDHIVFVRDDQGCESEWNITFPESVILNPVATVEYVCVNNATSNIVTVTVDESITNPTDLDYSLNGGPYQASNIFPDVVPGIGHYIDVRHTNGCIQTTNLFDVLLFDQALTLNINEGELNEIIATATGGSGGYTYTFNDEDYGSTNTFTITESGQYTITVTDSSGCFATVSLYLEFIDPCIPNYFTPDGDGVQDGWAPGCTENYPNLTFSIFDRYGRKIATLRQGQTWDGRYNNTELPTGDYWYVVKLNSETNDREFVGHFTLYR